ncbi:MAG: Sip1-related alpha-galactosidase [Akkermansiaceae bacterium]|nr:Sip1-related alpha-galactosidase [Akkermansiaceae bacterium]
MNDSNKLEYGKHLKTKLSKPFNLPVSILAAVMAISILHGENISSALVELPGDGTVVIRQEQTGQWVELSSEIPFSEKDFVLGRLPALEKFVSCFRGTSSCWMESRVGASVAEVPAETQFLLARLADGNYLAMVPLLDGAFRSSISGGADGRLHLLVESGDTNATTKRITGLYVEVGPEPFALVRSATARVRARQQPVVADAVPQVPDFVRYFGWCSWNAFYDKVTHAGVMQAMRKFEEGGVSPGFVVLDDGWQSAADKMLTGYEANPERFPDGLAATVRELKQAHHVSRVLAWHAYNGYWRGSDPRSLPALGIQMVKPFLPARLMSAPVVQSTEKEGALPRAFYPTVYRNSIGEPDLSKFFAAYHGFLRKQGVDGVKIDAMSWVETLGEDRGGRVRATRELVDATVRSEREIFDHNVIWCSSCSNDCVLQSPRSAVMRTSTDFFPDKKESHGRHVINNALNSLWMGEFIIPDWDMFQTHHLAGKFHAAARAISGGPVYVSDELGKTDFAMLRQLVLSDRTVPQCLGPARPTADSLFIDPAREPALFKVFNLNPAGGGVLGIFNCGYDPATKRLVSGRACVDDVPGLAGEEFAVFSHGENSLRRVTRADHLPLALRELEFEILTLVPIREGFAAIGLADKLNSGGCVSALRQVKPGHVEVDLRDGGEFLAWSRNSPQAVLANGRKLDFGFDKETHALRVDVPRGRPVTLIFEPS